MSDSFVAEDYLQGVCVCVHVCERHNVSLMCVDGWKLAKLTCPHTRNTRMDSVQMEKNSFAGNYETPKTTTLRETRMTNPIDQVERVLEELIEERYCFVAITTLPTLLLI